MDDFTFEAACTIDPETDALTVFPYVCADGSARMQFVARGEGEDASAVLSREDLVKLHAFLDRHLWRTKPAAPAPASTGKLVVKGSLAICPRCGDHHDNLVFRAFFRPMNRGSEALTHWAACPVTGEPIAVTPLEKPAQLPN